MSTQYVSFASFRSAHSTSTIPRANMADSMDGHSSLNSGSQQAHTAGHGASNLTLALRSQSSSTSSWSANTYLRSTLSPAPPPLGHQHSRIAFPAWPLRTQLPLAKPPHPFIARFDFCLSAILFQIDNNLGTRPQADSRLKPYRRSTQGWWKKRADEYLEGEEWLKTKPGRKCTRKFRDDSACEFIRYCRGPNVVLKRRYSGTESLSVDRQSEGLWGKFTPTPKVNPEDSFKGFSGVHAPSVSSVDSSPSFGCRGVGKSPVSPLVNAKRKLAVSAVGKAAKKRKVGSTIAAAGELGSSKRTLRNTECLTFPKLPIMKPFPLSELAILQSESESDDEHSLRNSNQFPTMSSSRRDQRAERITNRVPTPYPGREPGMQRGPSLTRAILQGSEKLHSQDRILVDAHLDAVRLQREIEGTIKHEPKNTDSKFKSKSQTRITVGSLGVHVHHKLKPTQSRIHRPEVGLGHTVTSAGLDDDDPMIELTNLQCESDETENNENSDIQTTPTTALEVVVAPFWVISKIVKTNVQAMNSVYALFRGVLGVDMRSQARTPDHHEEVPLLSRRDSREVAYDGLRKGPDVHHVDAARGLLWSVAGREHELRKEWRKLTRV